MAYAGNDYGAGQQYTGNATNAINPVTGNGGTPTERAAAAIVIGSLVALIMIQRGFRGVSVRGATGGLVRP